MAGRIPHSAFMAAFGGGDQPRQTAVSGRGEKGRGGRTWERVRKRGGFWPGLRSSSPREAKSIARFPYLSKSMTDVFPWPANQIFPQASRSSCVS